MDPIAAFIVAILLSGSAWSQAVNNVWYFGARAGLDFNSGAPVQRFDGRHAGQSCGSVCDTSGALLFYVGADTMYNGQQDTLANGCDLFGDATRMSSIIVPKPGHPSTFFAFAAKSAGYPDYSPLALFHEVDMDGNGGAGICVQKRVVLHTHVSTMVTAVPHANGIDHWALFHEWGTNRFLAFAITNAGVDTVPVASEVGEIHYDPPGSAVAAIGCLKPSVSGGRLVLTKTRLSASDSYLDLFNFDNASGIVSAPLRIADHDEFYAAEFSPNGQLLYASIFRCDPLLTNDVVQFDVAVNDSAAIVNSMTLLSATPYQVNCVGAPGVIAQGPDRKVYVALREIPFISVINFPDVAGVGCDFQYGAISLGGRLSYLSLPNQEKFVDTTMTSVGQVDNDSWDLVFFPVPAGNELQFRSRVTLTNAPVEVFDLSGRVVINTTLTSDRLDVSDLTSGVYVLRLELKGRTEQLRFTKE